MIKYKISFLSPYLLFVCLILLSACSLNDLTTARVRADALEAHVRFLSDDLLGGRLIGSPGEQMAAKYVQSQLRLAGLTEVTLQSIPIQESTFIPTESFFRVEDETPLPLTYNADYVLIGNPEKNNYSIRAPMVFAGYGITDLDAGWDDYKGLNIKGKIAVVLFGTPTHVAWTQDKIDYYSTWGDYKKSNAFAHGAVGLLVVWTKAIEASYPWHAFARENTSRYDWLDETGSPSSHTAQNYYLGGLNNSGLNKILSIESKAKLSSNLSVEDAYNQGIKINIIPDTVSIKIKSKFTQKKSYNVIGRIAGGRGVEGSLAITAHMDGLGIIHDRSGDTIRNGAVDNAAGVAVLLEMARAVANQPKKQLRNMLFVATSGEEYGFIGANYFVKNFKDGKLIGAINIDEPAILFRPETVVARGAEHSSLKAVVNLSAQKLDYKSIQDPWPSENFLVRGDSYEFIKAGIPSVWLMSGFEARDKSLNGEQIMKQWRQTYYHQPSDDMFQPLDFEACADFANLNLLIALTLANDPMKPTWNERDFFGERFGKKVIEK